jgi:hypothetical protein
MAATWKNGESMKTPLAAAPSWLAAVVFPVLSGLGVCHGALAADQPAALPIRDGSHDFDWEIGTWKTHLKVLRHLGNGSTAWVEYQGTSVVRAIWNGRANMVELEVDGPGGHLEALNLRLYNPQSHQWSLNFANASVGAMPGPPTVGQFTHGRGTFYDMESIDGRPVLVRAVWSDVSQKSGHFEQAISDDGGKNWQVNWIADDVRIKEASAGDKDK